MSWLSSIFGIEPSTPTSTARSARTRTAPTSPPSPIELDRILSPDRQGRLEGRAARVVGAILADSRTRQAATPPAKAARIEFWRRRRLEHLRHEGPAADGADARQEPELQEREPDEVRMARPVLAALRDELAVQGAPDRLRAIADRPLPHRLLDTRRHFPTSRGPRTIGSHGRSSSAACPARAAGVRSSATRRANARASRGPHIGSAWRPSRRSSERDTQITARRGLSGEVHPIVGGAVPHIRCRPSRSGSSTRSSIHRSRQPPPRRSEFGSAAPATSPSTPITSASSMICPNAYEPSSRRFLSRNANEHHSRSSDDNEGIFRRILDDHECQCVVMDHYPQGVRPRKVLPYQLADWAMRRVAGGATLRGEVGAWPG